MNPSPGAGIVRDFLAKISSASVLTLLGLAQCILQLVIGALHFVLLEANLHLKLLAHTAQGVPLLPNAIQLQLLLADALLQLNPMGD